MDVQGDCVLAQARLPSRAEARLRPRSQLTAKPVQCFPCSRTVWITAWPLFTPFPLCCGRSTLPRPPNPRLGHHLLWPAACVEASNLLKILCHPSHSEEESIPPFVSLIGPVTCFDQQNVAKAMCSGTLALRGLAVFTLALLKLP